MTSPVAASSRVRAIQVAAYQGLDVTARTVAKKRVLEEQEARRREGYADIRFAGAPVPGCGWRATNGPERAVVGAVLRHLDTRAVTGSGSVRGTGRSSARLGLAKIAKGEAASELGDVPFDVVEGVHRLADRCVIVSADAAKYRCLGDDLVRAVPFLTPVSVILYLDAPRAGAWAIELAVAPGEPVPEGWSFEP